MLFKKIISKEGWELRLHEQHEIFSIPLFKELNYDESLPISYTDLYMLAFNNIEYSLLTKQEIHNHLELLDKICHINKQKELLDYAIANYQKDIEEWKSFINPSVIEIAPEFLITFPEYIDDNLEAFSELKDYDGVKREKLLEYAHNNNIEAFSLLFDKSLVNKEFLDEIFKYGIGFAGIIMDENFNKWDQCMKWEAYKGNKELVDFFIKKGANNWNQGMFYAAQGGHKDLVLFFIEKGAHNWNEGMTCAAEGGHKELVLLFINKGANNWNECMMYAAYGGHKDLIELFIEKGANNWNMSCLWAKMGRHYDLVEFFNKRINNL